MTHLDSSCELRGGLPYVPSLRPVVEGLGYSFPRYNLPYPLVWLAAYVMDHACTALRPIWPRLHPILSPMEVDKCAVSVSMTKISVL